MNTLFRRTRRFVMSSTAIVVVSLASAAAISAQECEEPPPDDQPCTLPEVPRVPEVILNCAEEAFDKLVDCGEGADSLRVIYCDIMSDFDYLACVIMSTFTLHLD